MVGREEPDGQVRDYDIQVRLKLNDTLYARLATCESVCNLLHHRHVMTEEPRRRKRMTPRGST